MKKYKALTTLKLVDSMYHKDDIITDDINFELSGLLERGLIALYTPEPKVPETQNEPEVHEIPEETELSSVEAEVTKTIKAVKKLGKGKNARPCDVDVKTQDLIDGTEDIR